MAIWAIADLHLSFGTPGKEMDVFGTQWKDWTKKIETNWRALIQETDLVLIAGDISWATKPEDAAADLNWIHRLPGTKVIIRGNHDYWWTSISKVEKVLPSSVKIIQNNAFDWNDISIGGARLWDTTEFNFLPFINFADNPRANKLAEKDHGGDEAERIFLRELTRLELSLNCLNKNATLKIVMTHYPPIGAELHDCRVSALLEKHKVDLCVFGHLHNLKQEALLFGTKNGITYHLTSCDYLNFTPIKIA